MRFYITLIFLSVFNTSLKAQNNLPSLKKIDIGKHSPKIQPFRKTAAKTFIQNTGLYPDSVLYSLQINAATVIYFYKNSFRISEINATAPVKTQYHAHEISTQPQRVHSFLVTFKNASDRTALIPQRILPYKTYYLGKMGAGASKDLNPAHAAEVLIYKNIYPGIDVRFFIQNEFLKYNIIVAPGADLSQYQVVYNGLNRLKVRNRRLTMTTSLSVITEHMPEAYQLDSTGEKVLINVKFQENKKDHSVFFKCTDSLDSTQNLIIDPALIFATFSGATVDNWGFTATYGKEGELYLGGIVFRSGYLGTTGAYQPDFINSTNSFYSAFFNKRTTNILLQKFSSDGSRLLYSTYIGGDGDNIPHSLMEDNKGNLLLLGRTGAPLRSFPGETTQTLGPIRGPFNILICRISPKGDKLLKTWLIGGSNIDGANGSGHYRNASPGNANGGPESTFLFYGDDSRGEINIDKFGNVYVATQTQSADFPVTPNAFQKTLGGKQDAVVLKLDPDMNTVLFSSYLGGSENDAAYVISIAPTTGSDIGNIYVAGSTKSNNLPLGISRKILKNYNANANLDGFVVAIDGNNFKIKERTYIGTVQDDGIYGLRIDKNGFVYVMGVTFGNWPVINAAYANEGSKLFVGKLKPDLSAWEYTTVFGRPSSQPNISPVAFAVDQCEHVYVAGFGSNFAVFRNDGTRGMPVTRDALKSNSRGDDFYFIVLDKNAKNLLYATFYGLSGSPDHVDGGTSRYDPSGIVYQGVCSDGGSTLPLPYPTTPGAYAPVKGSGRLEYNMLGIKLDFQLAGVVAQPQSIINGIPNRNIGCAPAEVTFRDLSRTAKFYKWDFGDGTEIPNTTEYQQTHLYPRSRPDIGVPPNLIPNPYPVTLTAYDPESCNQEDVAELFIYIKSNRIIPDFEVGLKKECQTLNYTFFNTSIFDPANTDRNLPDINEVVFEWDFGDGSPKKTSKGLAHIDHLFPAIGNYNIKISVHSDFICNYSIPVERLVRISNNLKADFNTPDGLFCTGATVSFKNTSAGGESFRWSVTDPNLETHSIEDTTLSYTFNTKGQYVIKLHGFDKNTCNLEDSISKTILVSDAPDTRFRYQKDNNIVQFINESSDAKYYDWDFGDGQNITAKQRDTPLYHLYDKSGTYNVCLSAYNDKNSCVIRTCQTLSLEISLFIEAPNAFSPNGDGLNDVFLPVVRNANQYELKIYNRWGQVVFQSTDPQIGWNGRIHGKGNIQPSDAYPYTISVRTPEGNFYQKKGNVFLIK